MREQESALDDAQTNQGWLYQDQVKSLETEFTLLQYYTQRYRHSSQSEWQDRIQSGQILVDGRQVPIDTPLQPGQQLTYCRSPWEEPDTPLDFDVLYDDSDLLVVAKPAGLPVLPGGSFLEHTLLRQLQKRYPTDTPVPIHRLGRGTSGLVLLARSPLARSHLSQQMRDRLIRKTYRALVGHVGLNATGRSPIKSRFTITHPIGKIPYPDLGYIYGATPDGRFAHSDCQVLKRNAETTLLEVTILTGRPHQIRIHLAAAGYPLVGDPLYGYGGVPKPVDGKTEKLPVPSDCGYLLHAYSLGFTHPRTGASIRIVCPAPPELD